MTNTASILWSSADLAEPVKGPGEWTFYSQVSVSGPSVSTTVHRGERVAGPVATLDAGGRGHAGRAIPRSRTRHPVALTTIDSGDRGR